MAILKKVNFTKEWCLGAAADEANLDVGVGLVALAFSPRIPTNAPASEDSLIAFSRFVALMRRKRSLTLEAVSSKADVELGELVTIEEGLTRPPEPRTVYQLAKFFDVPSKALLRLSGLSKAKDSRLEHEAVRFAARSESIEKLTKEEAAALETFVAVLAEQK